MLHDKAERSTQIGAFDSTVVNELVKRIKETRPAFAQAIPCIILEEMAISGLERARQRGLYDMAPSMSYVMLMFELGANFEQVEPVASLMRDKDVASHARWRFIVHNIAAEHWQQIARSRDDRLWYPELFQQKQKSYFLDSAIPEDIDRFIGQGRKELGIHHDLLSEELALASIDVHESERESLTQAINDYQHMRGNDLLAAGCALLDVVPSVLDWWSDAGKRESTFMRIMALKKTVVSIACKIIGLELLMQQHAALRVRQVLNIIDRVAASVDLLPVSFNNDKLLPAQTHNGQKRPALSRLVFDQRICVTTGEMLLEEQDFVMHGPQMLRWTRHYVSSDTDNYGLGTGWRYTGSATLQIQFNQVVLFDEDGRIIHFDLPQINQGRGHRIENLVLWREDEHTFRLQRENITDVFTGNGLFKYVSLKVDRNGHAIQFQRNKENRLEHIIDSCGRKYAVAYNPEGLISAISQCDERGAPQLPALVYYQYDNAKRLAQALDALGQNERFQYEDNLIVRRILKSGFTYTYEWDGQNAFARCVKVQGQTGVHQRRFEYSTLNRISKVHTAAGARQYHYNEVGLLIKYIEIDGRETAYEYDADSRLKRIVDAAGNHVRCLYNIYGDFISFQNPLCQNTRFYYDENHRPIRMLDANSGVWLRDYDHNGNVRSVTNPLGQRTELHYSGQGLLERIIDSAGKQMYLVWQDGLLSEYHDASGRVTRYVHDEKGRLVKVIDWVGLETDFQYDLVGRVLNVKHCDGSVKAFKYDSMSNLLSYTDEKGRLTQYVYHGLTQPLQRIDADGRWVHYEYDDERRLVQLRHDSGDNYHFQYDHLGRLQSVDINGDEQHLEYDEMDFVIAWYYQDQPLVLHRNALGMITGVERFSQSIGEFSYDDMGRLTHGLYEEQKRHFLFDIAGQLLEEQCNDLLVRYEYDAAGRRTRTVTPNGREIRCVYDEIGALSSVDGQPVYQYKQAEEIPAYPHVYFDRIYPAGFTEPLAVQSHEWISSTVPLANSMLAGPINTLLNFYHGGDLFCYPQFEIFGRVAGVSPSILQHDPAVAIYGRFELKGQLDAGFKVENLAEAYLTNKNCNLILFDD